MNTRTLTALLAGSLLLVAIPARAQESDEARIQEALSAGPSAVTGNATVVDWDGRVLRRGSNQWTCYPTPPWRHSSSPRCLDPAWVAWARARASRTEPGPHGFGIAYMLAGDAGASNSDPFATDPSKVDDWVNSGSHIMILTPDPAMLDDYTTDYTTGGPYVMYKGTPYAHVMVPVGHD